MTAARKTAGGWHTLTHGWPDGIAGGLAEDGAAELIVEVQCGLG